MKSTTTQQFRDLLAQLPEPAQRQVREAFHLFRTNPNHPSLHFKPLRGASSIYSVRVGIHYRALGVRRSDYIVWFWIGSHADYDKLVPRL